MKRALILIFFLCLFASAVVVYAQMGMNMGMGLGAGEASLSTCGAGYDALTGSDTNIIHDSTGGTICCPQ